ncbi:AhpA/YtjB family protein [Alteromonas sp. a30]|uniref:AhpA/YtjB family protein n=1 Tax=Alteromonas sp. a30 TaxID=2730917 RepID=UPI002280EBD3|nr:AhpA/YtjB family protein [Alteromonas sp. a30]MCY7296600.1 hypothetical protein [Alteromonas sp. a30]
MKLNSPPQQLLELPSRYSVFKRIALLVLTLLVVFSTLYVWLSSHASMNTHYFSQADEIGKGLTKQYQRILQMPVAKRDFDRINTILSAIVNDPQIITASVFDASGRVIAQQPQYQDFVHLHEQGSSVTPLTFMSELIHPDKADASQLGYLRLVMDAKLANNNIEKMEHAFLSRTLVIMLLALLSGIVLTRSFYKWRMKSLKIKTQKRL